MSKKQKFEWLFPVISLIMFATLLGAIMREMPSMTMSMLVSFSAGLLAYTMMLTVTFIGSRPRFIEKYFGMPEMFEVHAVMSVILSFLVLIHIGIQFLGIQELFRNTVSSTGYLGVISLILVMFSGIFSLSGIFVNSNRTLRKWKETKFNREINLWLHRLAIVSIIAIYFHMSLLSFLSSNTLFMILLNVYTIFVLGYYAYWKFKIYSAPKYEVKLIEKGTPSLYVIEFVPKDGQITPYTAGDYFFIRFQGADITTEGHPFSTSAAITPQYDNSIEFMIKEAGDWTRALANIKVGDVATLEGPYGNFLQPAVDNGNDPYILLGGGIGLTPNLSVLRHEIYQKHSQRKMFLVWGLAYEEDLFLLDELNDMKQKNPNFSYHIIFSNEDVEGYDSGFITYDYLDKIGATEYFDDAHFFVCGPPAMLTAAHNLLKNANIPEDHISLDDFGF